MYRRWPKSNRQFSKEEDQGESYGEEDEYGRQRRLEDTSWCSCGKCPVMMDPRECICCQVLKPMQRKTKEQGVHCITSHPGFLPVVLDPYVLETAYHSYRKRWRHPNRVTTGRSRYTAYRQLVRWCWGILGTNRRVPLPACAVSTIRAKYSYEDV